LKRHGPRALASFVAVFSLLCGAACAVPLSPGYQIVKESRDIRFVPGQPPALAIHAQFTLVNSGNGDLNFVDVRFPSEETFGRRGLRIELDGHDVAPVPLPEEYRQAQPDVLRVSFERPWKRKEKRELSVEYTLRSPADFGSRITIELNDFHLGSRGWSPQLQPPNHLLAPYPKRPDRMYYTVRVPVDFVVLARGVPKGRKTYGNEIEYRCELRRGDLAPYIVAGHYVEWPAKSGRHSTVFWTVRPLQEDPTHAAEKIMQAWDTLEKVFGPLDEHIGAPHIVESRGVRGQIAEEAGPAAVAFPGGALVNPAAFALGIDSDRFLQIVSHALAHNWFGDEMYPSPDAALGIGEGLPEYATIVIDEARDGPTARRQRIYEYLRRYDNAVKYGKETPLGVTTLNSPLAAREIAVAKAPLFFIALEDACGEAPVRAGLANLVKLLRGQEVGYDDLRSALEESTGRQLGKLFREWIYEKGIPKNFRDRYPYGEGAQETGE
jgi:Peptidase family M1 domain